MPWASWTCIRLQHEALICLLNDLIYKTALRHAGITETINQVIESHPLAIIEAQEKKKKKEAFNT